MLARSHLMTDLIFEKESLLIEKIKLHAMQLATLKEYKRESLLIKNQMKLYDM